MVDEFIYLFTSFDSWSEGVGLLQLVGEANKKEWLFNLPSFFRSFRPLVYLLLSVLCPQDICWSFLCMPFDLSVLHSHQKRAQAR
jgi:hypothetical protein